MHSFGRDEDPRRAAQQHCAARRRHTGEFQQLVETRTERHLVDAGARHTPGHREELRAGTLGRAHIPEGLRPTVENHRHVVQCLDVVHHRGSAEQPDICWERRLRPGLTAVALQGVEQCRLLPADVGTRTAANLHVEPQAAAHHVGAEQPAVAGLLDCVRHALLGLGVLTSDVDVALGGTHGRRRDRHRFDQRVRIAFQQHAVLEGARLGLIGVAHDEALPAGRSGDTPPFHPRREGGPSPTPQS